MGSIIGGIVLILVALAIVYFSFKSIKKHKVISVCVIIVAIFIFLLGALGALPDGFDQVNHRGEYSPSAKRASSVSESKKKASESSSKAYDSSVSKAQTSAKEKGVKEINDKIDSDPNLQGLHVTRQKDSSQYGDYEVTVPDSVTSASDNEQKSIYSDIVKIITNYTGDDNPTVLFNNSNGDTVAETSTFGKIKLDN